MVFISIDARTGFQHRLIPLQTCSKGTSIWGWLAFTMQASLLTLATSLGIVAAMSLVWSLGGWRVNEYLRTVFVGLPTICFSQRFRPSDSHWCLTFRNALWFIVLGGSIGHGSRYLMMHFGIPIEWATFFAATVVGMIGAHWSHKLLGSP